MKLFTSLHVTVAALALLAAGCSRDPQGAATKVQYDPQTGHLQRLEFDSNHDGRIDSVSYMDGTRLIRIEEDLDGNGKVDRWNFYKPDHTLDKVGFSTKNDGVMDSQAFYDASGVLTRIEISTRRNGRFDRTEYYEGGHIARTADDTNGDGRPDKWDQYGLVVTRTGAQAYAIVSSSFDDSGSGRPERRFVYGPGGSIARVEFDAAGTGRWILRQPTPPQPRAASTSRALARKR